MNLLSRSQATTIIRQDALDSSRIHFTRHVRERMKERQITDRQGVSALRTGVVVDDGFMSIHGDPRYRVSGRGAGDNICVVVAINLEGLIIVTTFEER